MHARLWRQRRRLILTFMLCACAGWIAFAGAPFDRMLQALLFGCIGLAATALALVALPETRWFLFKAAVIAPVLAFLSTLLPGWIMVTLALITLAMLPSQPWVLDRVRLPGVFRSRKQARIGLDRQTLWSKVFPKETNDHWDPYVRGIRPGRSQDTFFLVYEALSNAGELQIPIKVFDVESETHFKTRDLSQPDAAQGGPVIVTSHVIEANGSDSMLTLMEATWRPMLWTTFSQWLDDYLGDHTDRMAALLEGRRDWSLKGASLRSLTERTRSSGYQILQKT